MKIAIFWQKAASWRKIKEKRPHFKFNFTTRTSSIYLSRPFLKLGNGNRLTLVLLLHISTYLCRSVSSVEHGDDHPGSGESVPQGDSPKGPYIKYVTSKHL